MVDLVGFDTFPTSIEAVLTLIEAENGFEMVHSDGNRWQH